MGGLALVAVLWLWFYVGQSHGLVLPLLVAAWLWAGKKIIKDWTNR